MAHIHQIHPYHRRNKTIKYMPAECIYCLVMIRPGIRIRDIVRQFNLSNGLVQGRLNTLESRGFLLSEDEAGRLYPFDVYTSRTNPCQP